MYLILLQLACNPPATEDPSAASIAAYDPLPLVNPFIGTGGVGGGIGALNPGPRSPHGMVHVGPDTRDSVSGAASFYHAGGYYYPDDRIDGFSHNHAQGMGVPDYTGVLLMPRDGWDASYTREAPRSAPFVHEEEEASPGYYAVRFADDLTEVELSATPHGALHRYTFAEGASPVVILDLAHGIDAEIPAASISRNGAEIEGFQHLVGNYSGRSGGLLTWIYATFEPAPLSSGVWSDPEAPISGSASVEGAGVGMWLEFPEGTREVEVKLALSYVDPPGARANYAAELENIDFEEGRESAEEAWRAELAGVRVRGGRADEQVIFHTAHFHAAHWPSLFSDADGRYRGLDGEVHPSLGRPYYTDFSLWDTFRTAHPWFLLAHPARAVDFAETLVQMSKDGGSLPRWPLGHSYTGGMVGSPATQVLAETWLKGHTTGWDAEAGYAAALAAASGPTAHASRGGIEGYLERGYVAWEDADSPASLTLEYAWSDRALAGWAEALGAPEAARLSAQASSWENTWDPAQALFAGRYADGHFEEIPHADWWDDAFVEGNAWQYLWGAPQDAARMVEVQHGGDVEAFLARYDAFWAEAYLEEDDFNADSWYWHGNEPDLHYPHLAALLGRPEHSRAPVDFVLASRYRNAPDGLDGNDDGGTLSAWYLLASLGLYPLAGTPTYALSVPLFERVEIDRPEGTLVLRRPSPARGLLRVTSPQAEHTATLEHRDLLDGAELIFESAEP